ncbi:MAG: STAS domain-containing protein [Acidimicrobiia bacterium]
MAELTTEVGDGGVIALSGDLTGAAEVTLTRAFDEASEAGTVVLDFTSLDYMNSTGIGLLVTTLVRAQRSHVRLLACGLSDHYREIFSLTRLDEAIPVFGDAGEALASA